MYIYIICHPIFTTWFLYFVHHWHVDIGSEVLFCVSVQKRSDAFVIGGVNVWKSALLPVLSTFSAKIQGALLRVVGNVCYSVAFRQRVFGNWDLGLFNCKRKASNKKKKNIAMFCRERWDMVAAVSLSVEIALCGPYWRFPLSGQKQTQPRT